MIQETIILKIMKEVMKMSNSQIIILIFCVIAIVLAIWNLVAALQTEEFKKYRKELKEKEEKKDYYGRLK